MLKDDIARWDDAAKTMVGEEVITGKGRGKVLQHLAVNHPGEYFLVSYYGYGGKWSGCYWEHITNIRRTTLFA